MNSGVREATEMEEFLLREWGDNGAKRGGWCGNEGMNRNGKREESHDL